MTPAKKIRNAVAQVSKLRRDALDLPSLGIAVTKIKHFQSKRFAATYADLMVGGPYQAATRFFLDELYGDANYAERDAQFSRIAGALQRLLPGQAVATAVALAQLHALSEELDHAMGRSLLNTVTDAKVDGPIATDCYIHAWRDVARPADREMQLRVVLKIGTDLDRLTGTPGLRTALKVMRGPAYAAGLSALQRFLERGFDTFVAMRGQEPGARGFLAIIKKRESRLIELLFDADFETCQAKF